ncbi:MAG: AbrB/MazE/SpoVT family DNA-binding domain-containing protein [Nanoarchaeota archaeon]
MKRKVVQQGPATLMVSLPSKWVKENNVKKGDEVDIEEHKEGLTFRKLGVKKETKKIELTVKISYPKTIITLIRNLYINAYDEICLHFKEEKDILAVNEIVNYLIGYEIIEQNKERCIIRDIATENPEEYDILFRKVWLTIKTMGDVMIDSLKEGSIDLPYLKLKDINLNNSKFSCYCRRILFKHNMTNTSKGLANYIIINLIHMIGRNFFYITEYVKENKFKVKKETIDFAKKIIAEFSQLYNLYYQPEKVSSDITRKLADDLIKEAYNMMERDHTKNSGILYRLAEISRIVATTIPKIETVQGFEK